MEDIMKIIKSLEDSDSLLKGVTETVQNVVRKQKEGFLSMLVSKLGASLYGHILAGKGAIATSHGRGINKKGKGAIAANHERGIIRAGKGATKST